MCINNINKFSVLNSYRDARHVERIATQLTLFDILRPPILDLFSPIVTIGFYIKINDSKKKKQKKNQNKQ